jgi:aminopeptidase
MRHAFPFAEPYLMTSTSAPTTSNTISDLAIDDAEKHLRDVLTLAIQHRPEQAALIVMDTRSELSRALSEVHRL